MIPFPPRKTPDGKKAHGLHQVCCCLCCVKVGEGAPVLPYPLFETASLTQALLPFPASVVGASTPSCRSGGSLSGLSSSARSLWSIPARPSLRLLTRHHRSDAFLRRTLHRFIQIPAFVVHCVGFTLYCVRLHRHHGPVGCYRTLCRRETTHTLLHISFIASSPCCLHGPLASLCP